MRTDTLDPRGGKVAVTTEAVPTAIRCREVTKAYGMSTGPRGFGAALRAPDSWEGANLALDRVTLDVPPGEALGVIGPNGAGKSTLLKVIAGITGATAGTVEAFGSVRSVIELGAGFHPDLTGLENVRCLGVLHGQTVRRIDAAADEIIEFAGLDHARDLPLKQYSLGMRARLAFAVVTHLRPDILVVDEVLAVGDQEFQERCFERIARMVEQGTTLAFVSHEMGMVASVCSRVIQLRHGRIVDDGSPHEVIERYLSRSASRIAHVATPTVRVLDRGAEVGRTGKDSLRVWFDLELDETIVEPAIGFDVVLPLADPDSVVSASTESLPTLVGPGRYRITGTTDALWGVGRNMRFTLSIVDRGRQRVLDAAAIDLEVVGDLTGRRLSPLGVAMTIPMNWSLVRDGETDGPSEGAGAAATEASDRIASLRYVAKHYRARTHGATIRPVFPGRLGALRHLDIAALDGLSLDLAKGESVGLIGPNASGKTTLLRVLAGVTRADEGVVRVLGALSSLLELGAGFHEDLTGTENLRVLARLMGVPSADVEGRVVEAVAFAELADVVDLPLKTYSTGMVARLGLAMALVCPADLMLIDEVLAVGDEAFRRRAIHRLAERCEAGLTVVFVSHDLQLVEQVCERVVRLDHGRCVDDGPTDEVLGAYAGSSWAGGAHDAEGGVRVQPLAVDRHHIPIGGTLDIHAVLVVDEPVLDARLELALRSPPHDRQAILGIEERAAMSAVIETLVPSGHELTQPGTYRFDCRLQTGRLTGQVDVVLAAVDEVRQIVLAEAWEQVEIGAPEPGARVSFDPGLTWSVAPIGPSGEG